MTGRLVPALFALLVASPVAAQYVATTQAGVSYPTLTSATPVPLAAASPTVNDRGRVTVPIGFTFPYYARAYTSVTITANGLMFFEPGSAANATADFLSNFAIPNVSEPNGLLAPLWDDLDGNNAGSQLRSQALTGPNGQGLAVEWKDWNRKFATDSLTFQVRLWENGLIEFFYGAMTGTAGSISATVGIESPSGSAGTSPFTCGAQCDLPAFDPTGTGQLITYVRFGPPAGVDLQANGLRVLSMADVGPDLQVTTELTMRNFGTLSSGPFTYRLYLSTDTIFDAADIPLLPAPQGPLTIPAYGGLVATAVSTVPRPSSGSYYLLAVVDDANVVTETNETNNTVATSVPYAAGVDLVAESVSVPSLAGPGDPVTIDIGFTNQGFDLAGNVPVKLWVSTDAIFSADDRLLYSTTLSVSGGQNVRQSLSFTMPAGIRAGDYLVMLQLNDGQVIPELSYTNNAVFSATRMSVQQADLTLDSLRVLTPALPYDETSVAFFGEPIRLEAVVRNQGGATAPNVTVAFYLSDNELLNGLTDPFIGEVPSMTLAPGDFRTVTLTANVPTRDVYGQLLQRGLFDFFGAAISPGLAEISGTNNFAKSSPTVVRAPAPNLVPLNVRGPQRIGAGEVIAVNRTLANLGNRPALNAGYRYYLSANAIVTTDDLPLQIQTVNGLVDQKHVDLAVGEQNQATEVLKVPEGVPASSFYLGVLMDPDQLIDEGDENDNGLAGQQVDVVAQRVGLGTPTLPDAIVGQPYQVDLAGVGGTGTYTFELLTPGDLPAGLTLSSAGRIAGVPTTLGNYAVTILVHTGGRTAEARRALRVVATTASVAITSTRLPAPARMLAYDTTLGVQGGRTPYTWSVASGSLPAGLTLTPEGELAGTPSGSLGTASTFTLQVRDAVGNGDAKSFTLTVVDATPFTISTHDLPGAVVGVDYLTDIVTVNQGGAPVSRPVSWNVIDGAIPDGLTLEPSTTERIVISGTPTVPGLFSFVLEAVDAQGRADSVNYLMLVTSAGIVLSGAFDPVLRGSPVSVQLAASPQQTDMHWYVRDGRLPTGVALDENSGVVSGTIADDAPFAPYVFSVGLGRERSRLLSVASFRIEVVEVLPKKPGGCGCSGAETGALAWAVLAFGALRRRAGATTKHSRHSSVRSRLPAA